MSAIIAGAAVGVASLGYGIYKDAHKSHQANVIEKNNIRPTQYVDPIYQQNVNTAQNLAQQGIAQPAYNNQENAINQNQGAAISALNNSANPGANLASIVRAGNNASSTLNAQDAIARNKNTLLLMQQRGLLAGAKQNAFDYNYKDKYSEQLAKSQALRGAAEQTGNNTVNAGAKLGMAYANYGNIGKKSPTYPTGFGTGGDE